MADVQAVVFSKDRPLQLDGLLQSIDRYAPGLFETIDVIFRATTEATHQGYRRLMLERLDGPWFWRQTPRFDLCVEAVLEDTLPLVCFLCDDDLFIREPDYTPPAGEFFCWSPRLSPETNWSYALRHWLVPTRCQEWQWEDKGGDLGYPWSLDGHVYRRQTALRVFREIQRRGLPVSCPNELEHHGACAVVDDREHYPARMSCGASQSLVSIPANRVTDHGGYQNHVDPAGRSWQELADLWLKGFRLDVEATAEKLQDVHSPHADAELVLHSYLTC